MNQGTQPTPEPDPGRLSIESLEAKLRALPPQEVPGRLSSNLIATIPAVKVAGAAATGVVQYWPWIAAVTLISVAASTAMLLRQAFWTSKPELGTNPIPGAAAPSTTDKAPPATSKAIQQYESAVRLDPFNADAWFSLAKAQADVHRAEDARSSAQKALDIARSRNRSDLVGTIEAWLRTRRATKSGQSDR